MSHKKHLCCMSIFVASCWGQSTHAQTNDPLDPLRKPCNSQELAALNHAVDVARSLATKASAQLPARNSTQGAKFKRWFGGPDGDDDPIIKAVYDEMPLMLAFKKIWCLPPNSTTASAGRGTAT